MLKDKDDITHPAVSFFCPAYYDQDNIAGVVERAVDIFERIAGAYEIVIVNDGSPDNTYEVAERLVSRFPEVRAVHHPRNLGYGRALMTGFEEANGYPYVCFTDGDGQFDIGEVEGMLQLMNEYDVVIGFRLNQVNHPIRVIISRFYNIVVRTLFRVKFRDISCSLKVFKRGVIGTIDMSSRSPFIDAEIVLKAARRGFKVGEVGIRTYPRLHGRSSSLRPGNFLGTIIDMMRLWLDFLKGR